MKNGLIILVIAYSIGISLKLRDLEFFFKEEAKRNQMLCHTDQKFADRTYGWVECPAWVPKISIDKSGSLKFGEGPEGADGSVSYGPPGPMPDRKCRVTDSYPDCRNDLQ